MVHCYINQEDNMGNCRLEMPGSSKGSERLTSGFRDNRILGLRPWFRV